MLKLLISSILVYSTVEVINYETTEKNITRQIVDLIKKKTDSINVDNFFDAYKYVTIKTNGYTDIKTLNKDREIHNFNSTRKFRLVNTQDSEIAYKNYSGAQNWNKSRTSLSISISGNRISFTMYAKADAYATAWNAYWSRAWAKISLESVIFSNQ